MEELKIQDTFNDDVISDLIDDLGLLQNIEKIEKVEKEGEDNENQNNETKE